MSVRLRAVRWLAAHALAIGVVMTMRNAGTCTTTLASIALVLASIATLRGRTAGALASLAVGASFAAAAALSLTPARALFVFVAIGASMPALVLVPSMLRFDRAAAITALGGALLVGTLGAASLVAAGPTLGALGRAEAAWDLTQAPPTMRFCSDGEHGYYERVLEHRLGVRSEHVRCGESPFRDAWNAGYDDAVREHVEARFGAGALDRVLVVP